MPFILFICTIMQCTWILQAVGFPKCCFRPGPVTRHRDNLKTVPRPRIMCTSIWSGCLKPFKSN